MFLTHSCDKFLNHGLSLLKKKDFLPHLHLNNKPFSKTKEARLYFPLNEAGELYATYVTAVDVNATIALWIVIGLVSLASPTIILLNALVIIALRLRKELQRLSYVFFI